MKALKKTILLVLLLGLTGCGTLRQSVVLHPIEKSDIAVMQKGVAYTPEKDGYFLSKLYMEEVASARVESLRKVS